MATEIRQQKISPCLWFDRNAEEAVTFYTSVFSERDSSKNSAIGRISRYGKAGYETHKMPEGTAMTVEFSLQGQTFLALNGGPIFKFNEAISFIINCDTQEEVDYYWNRLSEGGDEKSQVCGWLKDKFGLSWQVVPKILSELLRDPDPAKAERVMNAMLQMKKIKIEDLKKAYDQK